MAQNLALYVSKCAYSFCFSILSYELFHLFAMSYRAKIFLIAVFVIQCSNTYLFTSVQFPTTNFPFPFHTQSLSMADSCPLYLSMLALHHHFLLFVVCNTITEKLSCVLLHFNSQFLSRVILFKCYCHNDSYLSYQHFSTHYFYYIWGLY